MQKIVSLLCVSAMILSLTACGESAGSSSAESGSTSESSASEQPESTTVPDDNAEAETKPATKPTVLKEGKLIRMATYSCEEDVLAAEEVYNDNGKLIKKFDAHNSMNYSDVTEYEYDANGNLIRETRNDDGELTIKEYDVNGCLIHQQHKYKDRSDFDMDMTYTAELDATGSHVVCKDDRGRIVREIDFADGKKTKETEYRNEQVYSIHEYDSNGNETYVYKDYEPDGVTDEEFVQEYDNDGKMTKQVVNGAIVENTEVTMIYDYDAEGNSTTIQRWVNGEFLENAQNNSYEYEYDEYGNKIKATMVQYGTTPVWYTVYEYKYD